MLRYSGFRRHGLIYVKDDSGWKPQEGDTRTAADERRVTALMGETMNFSYFPGCTLKTKAKDLDYYARECAAALGVCLIEPDNWQCCGGVYPLGSDEIGNKLSSVRALNEAKENGRELVAVCSACYHVLKRVNDDMQHVPDIQKRANNYSQFDEPYLGETNVLHYLELLRDRVGYDKLKESVKVSLKGRKIGAYYGCLLLRPSDILHFDDPENPTIIEDFIRALGAEAVTYQMRNECCGGYRSMEDPQFTNSLVKKIFADAKAAGCEELVTACPLCRYNLDRYQGEEKLPVRYITEVLAEALDIRKTGESDPGAEDAAAAPCASDPGKEALA